MTKNIKKQQKFPTANEVLQKKDILFNKIKDKKKESERKKSPMQTFLMQIKDEIEHAIIEENLSYSRITEAINEVYKVKITPATISSFAKKHLDVTQSKRNGPSKPDDD